MGAKISWVVTCEHASNKVPLKYESLIPCLSTHRGYDIGAKRYAERLAKGIGAKLFLGTHTRLLIDLNRSETNPGLFSEYTKNFSESERKKLCSLYHKPFRKKVHDYIAREIKEGSLVIHLSCHSFTPELHGRLRDMDVGILYDPHRSKEKAFAKRWKVELQKSTSLALRLNAPYRGTSDGHTTFLRLCFSQKQYIGIEIEVNQRLFTKDFYPLWENVWFPKVCLYLERACH
jgi:predicted N-formylglutamate amidohydrolase